MSLIYRTEAEWVIKNPEYAAARLNELDEENVKLRETLIVTTERLSRYVRVPVPVAPGLYATSAEEKASLEVLVKAWEILYPKASHERNTTN